MKYLLKFWDKKEVIVSKEVGEKLMMAKEKKFEIVKFNGGAYELKAISYIEPIKEAQKENLLPERVDNPVKKETLERMKKEIAEKFNWSN